MSTPNDIRIQAQTLSGTPVDSSVALIWLQEQMVAIAYQHFRSGKYVVEVVNVTDVSEPYTPENTVVQIDKVIVSGKIARNYEFHSGQIFFKNPGEYTVKYYALPTIPPTVSTEIEMPEPYVNALKFFIASRIRARYMGQSDTNAVSFYEEYVNALKEADVIMKRIEGRHRVMPPGRRTM